MTEINHFTERYMKWGQAEQQISGSVGFAAKIEV